MNDEHINEIIREASEKLRPTKEHIVAYFVTSPERSFRMQIFYGETPPAIPNESQQVSIDNGRGATARGKVTKVSHSISLEGNELFILYLIDVLEE
jgi:hypothetical protein